MDERRQRARDRRAYTSARLVAIHVWTVVGAIAVGAAVLNVFDVLAPVVEFLSVGSLVAFVASPIVNALEHRGMPRSAGALIALVVIVAVIVVLVMFVTPIFVSQLAELVSRLP